MKKTALLFVSCLLTAFCASSQSNWTIQFDTTAWKRGLFPQKMIVGGLSGAFYKDSQVRNISLLLDRKNECCAIKDSLEIIVAKQDSNATDYKNGISILKERDANHEKIDRNNLSLLSDKDKEISKLRRDKWIALGLAILATATAAFK